MPYQGAWTNGGCPCPFFIRCQLCTTQADIARIAELGFNSVRPALNSRLFLTEGDDAVYIDEGFQLLDNLFYQFHFYCWDRPDKLNDIGRFIERRKGLNVPVWVGETGEKDNAIYWATTQYFEANNIGWSFWPWKKMDATNGSCSIKAPEGWDAIRSYSRGGDKPSAELAQKAFDQLLVNIRLENCVFFPDVVNAMFRRAPGRIEAENYGHDGPNQSYFVKDAA